MIRDFQTGQTFPGKIVDYDEKAKKHKIRLNDFKELWIDINQANVKVYLDQNSGLRSNKLSSDAPVFDPTRKATSTGGGGGTKHGSNMALFHKLFASDYPDYQKTMQGGGGRPTTHQNGHGASSSRSGRYPPQPGGPPGTHHPHPHYPAGHPAGSHRIPPNKLNDPRYAHLMQHPTQPRTHSSHPPPPHGAPHGAPHAHGHPMGQPVPGHTHARPRVDRHGRPAYPPRGTHGSSADYPGLTPQSDYTLRHKANGPTQPPQKVPKGPPLPPEAEKDVERVRKALLEKGCSPEEAEVYIAQYRNKLHKKQAAKEAARKAAIEKEKGAQKRRVKGLIVLRGLPGSGKSTLARKLASRSSNAAICTEDKYHWSGGKDGHGDYRFKPELVFLAREWCTKEIRKCIKQQVNLIILDNHNARISMYEDHIQFAVRYGYRFRIIEFVATEKLIDKYRARSYKKFPREVYVKLLKLWERDPRSELINPTFASVPPPTGGPTAPTQDSETPQKPSNSEDGKGKEKEKEKKDKAPTSNNSKKPSEMMSFRVGQKVRAPAKTGILEDCQITKIDGKNIHLSNGTAIFPAQLEQCQKERDKTSDSQGGGGQW